MEWWSVRSSYLTLLLAPFIAVPTPTARPPAIAIAGLLGGNTLVPLAQYVGGHWVSTWPHPDEQMKGRSRTLDQLPRSWYPIPGGLPKDWFLWTEGAHGVPIRVTTPVLGEAHCQAVWGLSTALQPFGHETTAVATNVPSGVQTFERSISDPDDRRLYTFLKTASERPQIIGNQPSAEEQPPLVPRTDLPVVFELSCVNTVSDDDQICSFEGSRQLQRQQRLESGCDKIAVVQGWFAKNSREAYTLLQVKTTITDSDAMELRTVVPLVLITAAPKTFIVVKEHGYEDESFSVVEVHSDKLEQLLAVPGGGC